ncbi:hypothetical protein RB195_023362 [Necator americanus]|uniref:Uncharacterized protein n=1 Tax=Necator americanus TaxID=51031 RepID=A0ABR1EIU8_NECAM
MYKRFDGSENETLTLLDDFGLSVESPVSTVLPLFINLLEWALVLFPFLPILRNGCPVVSPFAKDTKSIKSSLEGLCREVIQSLTALSLGLKTLGPVHQQSHLFNTTVSNS